MINLTSDLPADEGLWFVTCVPDAPAHLMGRRSKSGELYVDRLCVPKEGINWEAKVAEGEVQGLFKVIRGSEASNLFVSVVEQWDSGQIYLIAGTNKFARRTM